MAYRIITDTCCDFPQQMYEELDLTVAPLSVHYKGESVNEYPESWLKEMYAGLRAGENATTSAANPQDWQNVIEPIVKAGQNALVLTFSSGLSTTYQSAVIAAEELMDAYPQQKILVVDTLSASMGQGLLVWYACQKRDEGLSLEELKDWCEDAKYRVCHWFTVDDLHFLKRGGRVSAATAVVGTMLQIKPLLHVDDEGHLINMAKCRGRKASIEALAKKVENDGIPGANDTVFISHGDCIEDANLLAEMLKERCGVKNVVISYVGAVIGSHSGPGTVAMFFLGEKR